MARTDARAVAGFDEALARCAVFVEEGADIVFFEAPESIEEMRALCAAIPKPCMANMVEGGKTPVLPPVELERVGYKLAAYPLVLLSAAISAMQAALESLRPEGPGAPAPTKVSFDALKTIVGFPDYWALEERFAARD
jgi:2-methylisocitrate lyase-like PEP mutase family enzyme